MTKLLIVDDDRAFRRMCRAILARCYVIFEAEDGEEALLIAEREQPEIVLLDLSMPGPSSEETCHRLRALTPAPQILMISGIDADEGLSCAKHCDVDTFLQKPVDPSRLRINIASCLKNSRLREIGEKPSHHVNQKLDTESEKLLDAIVFTLTKVAELRDNDTGQHLVRMREYSQLLAETLVERGAFRDEINAEFLENLYRASPLHDIGKVGIHDAILLKPGKLTPEEFEYMKKHTVLGGNILQEAMLTAGDSSFLKMAAEIAQFHHERWNGSGYLAGLTGRQIPLAARIVALADVYDALTSVRPYKPAWEPEQARENIVAAQGTHFDPLIVDAFLDCFDKFLEVGHKAANEFALTSGAFSLADLMISK